MHETVASVDYGIGMVDIRFLLLVQVTVTKAEEVTFQVT